MSVQDMTLKKSDGEGPVMLELWRMQDTPSLPSLPDLLWLGVEAPERVFSMGQIRLFDILNWVQTNDLSQIELYEVFDHLSVCKQMTDV